MALESVVPGLDAARIRKCLVLVYLSLFLQAAQADTGIHIRGGCAPERSATLVKKTDLVAAAISYCDGGDIATGDITLQFPASAIRKMDFYYAGYPDGKSVRFELRNSAGASVPINTFRKGELWRPLKVILPQDWRSNDTLYLVLHDESKAWTGWAGLGYSMRQLVANKFAVYLRFVLKAIGVCSLIACPGLWLKIFTLKKLPVTFIPIPGILILALTGLASWVTPPNGGVIIRWLILILYALVVIDLIRRLYRQSKGDGEWVTKENGGDKVGPLLISGLVFVQAIAIGINPLPIAEEDELGAYLPGRMIAAPGDFKTPYSTALYFYYRFNGFEHNKDFFGDWDVTSRGPLVPLGINAIFHLFNINPTARTGKDVARIYGWALNALVILGAFQLLQALGVDSRARKIGLVWVALSPVVLINTVFLWPKLLATYFILLALAAVVEHRSGLAGFTMALAWLSHPVGLLMLPGVGLFLIFMPHAERKLTAKLNVWFKRACPFMLSLIGTMAAWLIYKVHLGYREVFMTYWLGGGNGFQRAADFQSWFLVRLSNFWLTLSPGAFFYSQYMHYWLYGPIPDTLRWSIQYAKTLPGHLGFSCFLIAYLAVFRGGLDPVLRTFKRWILFGGFFVMIVFWGFSSDGLGRNSLEPLSVLLIVFAAASKHPSLRWLPALLPVLAIEGQWVIWSGFLYDPGFDKSLVKLDAWGCLIASTVISLSLVAIGIWRSNQHRQPISPLPVNADPCH